MGKQRTISPSEYILNKVGPVKVNPNQATPVFNSDYAQQYEGLPVNNETLEAGVQRDLAFTTEGYSSQIAKNIGAAFVNTLGFAAATFAAIPNIIDNQFNDGNDRIIKPINTIQNNYLEKLQSYQNPGNEDQSVLEYITPSWISGNTKSFWGDAIEQSGIVAGTALGTGALLGAARLIPGLAAAETALGTVVKNTLSSVIKPATLLTEQIGIGKGITNTINTQKFVNGLASAAKTTGLNAVQSYTEALFEGLDGERNFIESKIKEYETKYGYTPEGKELDEIKTTAEELKNTRFGLNMAGLMISNTSFTKAFFGGSPSSFINRLSKIGSEMSSEGKIITKQLDFLKGKPSYISKPLNFIANKMPLAYNEGLEEVYQMGVEKGLDNYYTNKINTEDFEANFSNITKSLGVGIESVLSKEGLKAFITGAGVGSIFQGVSNYQEHRSLNKYLDETTSYRDPLTKELKQITNREDLTRNLKDIDDSLGEIFTLDPLASNPVSLNQTLGERIQQFVTDNNNFQDSIKAEGSYIQYDQDQRTKFDSLFPYIKKGYKDVIVSKIEGAYQDLSKQELSDSQRQAITEQKQAALQDVETVEKFVNTIDNVFYEQFGHPILQNAQRQLKDLAVYHLWNIENINKQSKELTDIYGDNIFEDEVAKGFNGKNIDSILNKELEKLKPLTPDVDPYKEERAIIEKIKNSEKPTEAYFAYKQRNKPEGLVSSNDFLILKKQREYLQKRLQTNNDVIASLYNLKNTPEKSIEFLAKYYGEAENITKKTKAKAEAVETKSENKELIKKTIAPENQAAVEKVLEKKIETPLTPTDLKEAEEVVKKETKQVSSEMVKKTKEEMIVTIEKKRRAELEQEFSNVGLVKTTVEMGSSEVLQRQGIEWKKLWYGPSRVPVLDIIQSYKDINKKYDDELAELNGISKKETIQKELPIEVTPEVVSSTKPRRKRQESAKSRTGSKIFSDYIPKKDIQEAINKLEEEKASASVIEDPSTKEVIQKYDEQIQELKNLQKTDVSTRELAGTLEEATLESEVLEDAESHLFYDIGLIRTQLHSGPKEIYTINVKNTDGELVPAFTIQNNQDNLLLDLVLFNQFLEEFKTKEVLAPYYETLKKTGTKMPLVKFLESLLVLEDGDAIFNFIQDSAFTLKSDVETASDITEAGSTLKLFNFYNESLESLYHKLKGENNMYSLVKSGENTQDILSKLEVKFKDSKPLELPTYSQLIKGSGAFGLIHIENGEIFGTSEITPNLKVKLRSQSADQYKNGYYAIFSLESGKFLLAGARVSLDYKDLSEAGKLNFKIGMYYGKGKDDFWDVTVKENGTYELINTSTKESKILDNYDIFATWVGDTKAKLNATVSYFEKTQDILETIFEKGRVNFKVFKNNSVEVTPLENAYQDIEEPLKEEPMKEQPIEINAVLEEPRESVKFSFKIEKKGEYVTISDSEQLGTELYTLIPGVTEQQVEEYLMDSKKRTAPLKKQDLLENSGLYSKKEAPKYSSISNYQLEKIKEFIEKC